MDKDIKLNGRLKAFLNWPMYLGALVVLMTGAAFFGNIKAGLAALVLAVIYLGFALWFYLVKRPQILSELLVFAIDHAQTQRQLLAELNVPYALLDENYRILWVNREFDAVIYKEKNRRKLLSDVFEGFDEKLVDPELNEQIFPVTYGEKYFRLHLKNIYSKDVALETESEEDKRVGLIAAYLFDETNEVILHTELENQKLVTGLIYLDNYDETMESIEEVRRSLLMALIERKISKYIHNVNGVIKKLEKDKFFVILQNEYLEQLKEGRFALLEDVKTVNIGNDMSLSLSIGLGLGGDSYAQNYEYARTAIDMALGRGGDQAVVKDGDQVSYFGGKAESQEKNTRVRARVKAHALRELILSREEIFIMGHSIGDVDSLGSGIGIYRICASFGKRAHIVLDNVTTSVRPIRDRFVGVPEYPSDLFMTGEQALQAAGPDSMLVVVDVNRPSFTECPRLLEKISTVVVLDHHRQTREAVEGPVLSYVEPSASSASEMVAELMQYLGDNIRVRQAEADAMYGGIVLDTNNFLNKTGVRTFEAAAFLRRCGADVTRVRKMFRDSAGDYKAKAETVSRAEVFCNAFAISTCFPEGIESPTIIGAQAANELLNIVGIKASFVLTPYQDRIFISARSIDEVNVQVIMEKLGGGGHLSVAGAQLSCSLEEAEEKLKEVLTGMLEKKEL